METTAKEIKKCLKGKNVLITGGTGSFGRQIVAKMFEYELNNITIYSRDEKKHFDMRNDYSEHSDILDFVIGDVRDYNRVKDALRDIDIVYHAAALKQVPNCEFNPIEAVKTNVKGAENVKRASIENEVELMIGISTDKAVKPVNVMGMTKAIQERIILNSPEKNPDIKFLCVRYGNVIGSRGSVVPFFKKKINKNKVIPITHPDMTRFLLPLEEAINLVLEATAHGSTGQLMVKKMPACYITDLAKVMAVEMTGNEDYPIEVSGIRPGEKINETLVSEEEMRRAKETKTHYVIYPEGDLENPEIINKIKEYKSNNTEILDETGILNLLKKSGCF
jgi:FlaA1/EpsC-like NDP-sugar epimerase